MAPRAYWQEEPPRRRCQSQEKEPGNNRRESDSKEKLAKEHPELRRGGFSGAFGASSRSPAVQDSGSRTSATVT